MVDTDDTRRTIHDGRRTTPQVWHKLPKGELKMPKRDKSGGKVDPQAIWLCRFLANVNCNT